MSFWWSSSESMPSLSRWASVTLRVYVVVGDTLFDPASLLIVAALAKPLDDPVLVVCTLLS